MCRIGTPPSNAAALTSDKKPRRSGVLCRNRMRSGRNGLLLLDASFGGSRPRGCGRLALLLHIFGQLLPARFLGFARSPVHLVELIAHKHSFRIKRRASLPCHAWSCRFMLRLAPRKFNGKNSRTARTANLCYRCREINPFAAP